MAEPGTSPAPSLLCVGNLTIDEAVAPDGTCTTAVGGDALFAALAARLEGGRPRVLAPLGSDATDELRRAVALTGTDPASLPVRGLPTVRNVIHYAADGGRRWTLITGDDHFEAMSVWPQDVAPSDLDADGVLLSAMGLRAQVALAVWLRPRTDAVIYFDPQEDYIAGHQDELLEAVTACDVFLPSEVEAVALAGTDDLGRAAAHFLDLGPSVVVIKRAERGCLVATTTGMVPVPVDAVVPVDSTGAGDAFCGGFATRHLATGDPVDAARAGSRAARTAVGGPGITALVSALADQGAAAPTSARA